MKLFSPTSLPAETHQTPSLPPEGGEGRGKEASSVRVLVLSIFAPILGRGLKPGRSLERAREQRSRISMSRGAIMVFLILLMCIGFVQRASAHDPGLSSLAVKLNGSRLEAVATFAR